MYIVKAPQVDDTPNLVLVNELHIRQKESQYNINKKNEDSKLGLFSS